MKNLLIDNELRIGFSPVKKSELGNASEISTWKSFNNLSRDSGSTFLRELFSKYIKEVDFHKDPGKIDSKASANAFLVTKIDTGCDNSI